MTDARLDKVAARAAGISPSLTLAITAKAKKMKAEGISVIGFGAGEPDFNTPDYIIEAAKRSLDNGFTKYTESSGLLELRRAICDKFKNDNNLEYQPAQIVVSNGAKHSLFNAISAIIEEGDEVIIPSPYWLTYPELVGLAGGKNVFVRTTEANAFKLTAQQLSDAITPRTKAIILNSPSNPTGSVYNEGELREIAAVLEQSGIWIISDEIYEKLNYSDTKHISIASLSPKLYSRTITVNGMSKSYSMTGWRVGYLGAPLHIAKAIDALQSHATSNACTTSQYAALEALTNPKGEEFLQTMLDTFRARMEYITVSINKIQDLSCVAPEGAFYVMVNISKLKGKKYKGSVLQGSLDISEKMLDARVAAVPGIAFGDDDFLRLSYAISMDDIKEGLSRIESFCKELS